MAPQQDSCGNADALCTGGLFAATSSSFRDPIRKYRSIIKGHWPTSARVLGVECDASAGFSVDYRRPDRLQVRHIRFPSCVSVECPAVAGDPSACDLRLYELRERNSLLEKPAEQRAQALRIGVHGPSRDAQIASGTNVALFDSCAEALSALIPGGSKTVKEHAN